RTAPVSRRQTTTVVGLLEERASDHPARPFLDCAGERRTFGEMAMAMDATARGLAVTGVGPGDRVAVLLPNRMQGVELFFGCARLGAVHVPLNVSLRGDFLRHQVNDSGAETIVVDAERFQALSPVLTQLPQLRRIVTVGDFSETVQVGQRALVSYEGLPESGQDVDLPPTPCPADLCSILYTSGGTALPEGCMVTHGYLVHSGEVFADPLMGGLRSDDVFFTTMPLFHITGLAGAVLTPV